MKNTLQYLFDYKTLTKEQAKSILIDISNGKYSDPEVTAFVTVYLMRTITIEELSGFVEALMELCNKVDFSEFKTIDIVGTGGDGKNTFNISTLASFIVAGTGQKVAKQGNYGASTISGASNVMELLGYKFKSDESSLKMELDKANICFMHAPVFHPALKNVAPVRKSLGLRTFFNIVGPLVNPANPNYRLLGVYSLEMARIYTYYLQQFDKSFNIVYSLDGYDEISLTSDTKIISGAGERMATPEELGKRMVLQEDIYGGDTLESAAEIFTNVINGNATWAQNAVVLANAATALHCTGNYSTYEDAYQAAVTSLDSGNAKKCFKTLMELNK